MSARLTRRQILASVFAPPSAGQAADEFTPTARFFRQHTRPQPRLNPAYWSLAIGGLVRHPLVWSYNDLLANPMVDLPCTLVCAANAPGGERIGHALWHGVPVNDLLGELDIHPDARFARLQAADGHVTSVPLRRLRDALLAFDMNGAPLTPEHGFPARLVIPGLYDYKSPRWIERVDLTDRPVIGDWEARGWSADGVVAVTSAITSPRPFAPARGTVQLAGYAFAGLYDIRAIELSIEGGAWTPIAFEPGARYHWTRWRYDWQPPAPGDYEVRVRATDSARRTQPDDPLASAQPGFRKPHHVVVRVIA